MEVSQKTKNDHLPCFWCSVTKSGPTLWDPMGCSSPGFHIFHYLPNFAQTHVHWVNDSIQPSHFSVFPVSSCPQSFPASGSFSMSQFFISGCQGTRASASASVLPMNTQDWSPLGWTGYISLQSKGLSRVFSNTTVQKHQFFSTQSSLWTNNSSLQFFFVCFLFFNGQNSKVSHPLFFFPQRWNAVKEGYAAVCYYL